MRRYGQLVWGVCRNLSRSHADAEDTFQATFLVLARQAGSIKKPDVVGSCRPWVIVPATWRDKEVGAAEYPILLSRFRLLRLLAYGQPARQGEEHRRRQHRDDDSPRAH